MYTLFYKWIIKRIILINILHCTFRAIVRLGEHYTKLTVDCQNDICSPQVQDIPIQYVKTFEDLDEPDATYGDIALIKLARAAIYNGKSKYLCIVFSNYLAHLPQPLSSFHTLMSVSKKGWMSVGVPMGLLMQYSCEPRYKKLY